jgi:hypothetical protein
MEFVDRGWKVERNGGAELIPEKNLVAITIEDIKIEARNFRSSDPWFDKVREGFLELEIGGQSTTYAYSGKDKGAGFRIDLKYLDKILYFGRGDKPLSTRIRLVESDSKTRRVFSKIAKLEKFAGQQSLGGVLSVVSSGFGVLGALSKLIGSAVKDDEEGQFLGTLRGLKNGEICEYVHSYSDDGNSRQVVTVQFRTHDLGQALDSRTRFRLTINEPKFEWNEEPIEIVESTFGGEEFEEKYEISSDKYLVQKRDLKRFNFVANSQGAKKSLSLNCKEIDERLLWEELELFESKGVGSGGDKHIIPLAYGFSLNSPEINAEAWLGLVQSMLPIAEQKGFDTSEVEEKIEKEGLDALTKLNEWSKDELSLAAFDGVLFLAPASHDLPEGQGRMVLSQGENGVWEKRVSKQIKGSAENQTRVFGDFSFTLRIESV